MKCSSEYSPPPLPGRVDLDLSRNEGRCASPLVLPEVDSTCYPDTGELRAALATKFNLTEDRVLLTSGADGALMRTCLAALGPGAAAVLPSPTFEMIPRYVGLAGGQVRSFPWPSGPLPVDELLALCDPEIELVFVVSPNNPTGAVATAADLERIALALPDTLIVLDAAYGEFADDDLTEMALRFENVVVVRTFSKAWGLAGLRVGYALGSAAWIARLAAHGNPYPVSSVSAALALSRMRSGEAEMRGYVARVATERTELVGILQSLGYSAAPGSQANFVLALGLPAAWIQAGLGALGIGVRIFPDTPALDGALRITLPGNRPHFERLVGALRTVAAPEALLFDLDGVLADVSASYRQAILGTAASFGATATPRDVEAAKARGNANDDWALTWMLLRAAGVQVSLEEVTSRFEALYQGTPEEPGLREAESCLVTRELLARWKQTYALGVVTGRPRADALFFMERFGLAGLFDVIVCREDAELKPNPAPVRLALESLGVTSAWMLGDTRDDVESARGAGVLPIGVIAPGSNLDQARQGLMAAGAVAVLEAANALAEVLPCSK